MILRFFLLAYGITWSALVALAVLTSAGYRALAPLMLLGLLAKSGPSLAGLVLATAGGGERGLRDLLARLVPRVRDAGWIALAVLLPVVVAAAATGFLVAEGTPPGPTHPPSLATFLPRLAAGLLLGGGLGEELGWRGFALPRLQRALHPLAATVVLGLLWAGWHWPSLRLEDAGPGVSAPWFVATVVAMAVVFTWVWNRSGGSLLACALLHASADATVETMERAVPLLWTNGMADEPLARMWGAAALLLIAATRGRLGFRPSVQRTVPGH